MSDVEQVENGSVGSFGDGLLTVTTAVMDGRRHASFVVTTDLISLSIPPAQLYDLVDLLDRVTSHDHPPRMESQYFRFHGDGSDLMISTLETITAAIFFEDRAHLDLFAEGVHVARDVVGEVLQRPPS